MTVKAPQFTFDAVTGPEMVEPEIEAFTLMMPLQVIPLWLMVPGTDTLKELPFNLPFHLKLPDTTDTVPSFLMVTVTDSVCVADSGGLATLIVVVELILQ